MAAIFYLSSLSSVPAVPVLNDKAEHALLYAGLAALMVRGLEGGVPGRVRWRTAFLACAITVAYGAIDEFHQMFVSGRAADVWDVYVDAAGGSIGIAVCGAWGIIAGLSRHDL